MSDPFFERVGTKIDSIARTSAPIPDVPPKPYYENAQSAGLALFRGGQGERRWAAQDKTFLGVSSTYDALPAGVYRADMGPQGAVLIQQSVETDDLLELPDDAAAGIIAEFQEFWRIGAEFRKRGAAAIRAAT